MKRRSLTDYLEYFQRQGREYAYAQRRGYRMVRWTYREVAETAFRFARELQARGIGKGDRVLVWGPNSAEWVAAFLGCALRGVIAVPMDDAATPDFAQRVGQQVATRLLVGSRQHVQAASSVSAVVLEDLPEMLARYSATPFPLEAIEPDDALEIVFTSGTTAEP